MATNLSAKESTRLGKPAKAHDAYMAMVKKLPRVGHGWVRQGTYPLYLAKQEAKRALGSHHTAIIPSPTIKHRYEVWSSEVSTADIKKAPKNASYICRLIDYTLKKQKPHNFYKRV